LLGPFDFVVFASYCKTAKRPVLPGEESFEGRILVSSDFTTETFSEILREKKKVVLVGGGKTACDQVLNFHRQESKERQSYGARLGSRH